MDLARLGQLTVEEARHYVERFEPRLSMPDPRIGMDLDPEALSSGSTAHPGALLLAGGRVDMLVTPPGGASSVFVEGDLRVDGCLINDGHLLIAGDLVARDIYTQQYLVVLGEVRVGRYLGVDDGFGTRIVGDLHADDVVGYANHHLSLFGAMRCETYVDDEEHGREAVIDVLARWGVPDAGYVDLAGARAVFSAR
ncbi:hypothetical protein [Nocardia aurea]|uniref:Uncharacterized protein n=1 Tax=Nocardia aurea TaxID=2144174 RepID=A0ABV3FRG1_9NOCA